MDFLEVVRKRKTVRKYIVGKVISDKDIRKILDIINLAPSAKNLQSFKVLVVKSPKKRLEVAKACYNQRSDFVQNASLILVFCSDPGLSIDNFGQRGEFYSLQDATIAASFALLAITECGYSSCWIGNFKEKELQKVLSSKLHPIAIITVGYPDENPERKPRKALTELAQYF
ncbi:hypothetical protein A2Y99_01325 [Candidatus Gottesmanbacteria bacterium RBG_13_37_7]|uniref:Nitroreductase domain-containing protein n=1 Tax=Candidatus Gottesmanbacteria bacterium RBG_13_37_7 TaxID=1798369 RepID=A0A1F5YHK6_9BACT|nr:MAG: hypothetical protein A2Y99_01325 [Candidatus Gottesmanbacteria bacterium RBG_13_37_7]